MKIRLCKECKKMFDDYNEKLKERLREQAEFDDKIYGCAMTCEALLEEIDKLSKEVMGE